MGCIKILSYIHRLSYGKESTGIRIVRHPVKGILYIKIGADQICVNKGAFRQPSEGTLLNRIPGWFTLDFPRTAG